MATEGMVQDLSSFRMPAHYHTRGAAWRLAWWIAQELLLRWSPPSLHRFRAAILRAFGARVGRQVILLPTVRVHSPWNLEIGDHAWIGEFVTLYSMDRIVIGHNAVVSQHSYLSTGSHDVTRSDFPLVLAPIHIEPESWVGAGAFVMPGITIGRGAVVGARSVVTHDVPALAIVMGVPARIKGSRQTRAD